MGVWANVASRVRFRGQECIFVGPWMAASGGALLEPGASRAFAHLYCDGLVRSLDDFRTELGALDDIEFLGPYTGDYPKDVY